MHNSQQKKTRVPTSDLTQAIFNCDYAELEKLIEASADLEKTAGRWAMYAHETPLCAAISNVAAVSDKNLIELNQLLAKEGVAPLKDHADRRRTAVEIVKLLIRSGADINSFKSGRSPLNLAVYYRDLELVSILLKAGADASGVCLVASYNETALHTAARGGTVEIAKSLVRAGADPNKLDHEGRTPIEVGGQGEVAGYLRNLLEKTSNHA